MLNNLFRADLIKVLFDGWSQVELKAAASMVVLLLRANLEEELVARLPMSSPREASGERVAAALLVTRLPMPSPRVSSGERVAAFTPLFITSYEAAMPRPRVTSGERFAAALLVTRLPIPSPRESSGERVAASLGCEGRPRDAGSSTPLRALYLACRASRPRAASQLLAAHI